MNHTNISAPAPALQSLESLPPYSYELEGRLSILGLVLPDTGMTVNDAWARLNSYVSLLRTNPVLARENRAAMADVALSMWQAGIEYKRTTEGVQCKHEGWLLMKNSALGELNFPDIDHFGAMYDYAFMTMFGEEPTPSERPAGGGKAEQTRSGL